MNSKKILPVTKYISISEAENMYHTTDKTIRARLQDENLRARIRIDRSVRYDKDVLDEVLAGAITTYEIPLYKRFADADIAEALYTMSYNKLHKVAVEADALIKIDKLVYYDTWAIDTYFEEHKLW